MLGAMADPVYLDHPLAGACVAELRAAATPPAAFRAALRRVTGMLAVAATGDLATAPIDVTTPVGCARGVRLSQRVAVVPILRAGLGMVDPLLEMVPDAEVRHIGLYRDERTLEPVHYYNKLPADGPADVAIVLDPMLATGGSAVAALDALARWGVPILKLMAVVAAPTGVERVRRDFPRCQLYIAALDEGLNDAGFIVPGLGDAGDRVFHTASPTA